jgi:hypothetical protein
MSAKPGHSSPEPEPSMSGLAANSEFADQCQGRLGASGTTAWPHAAKRSKRTRWCCYVSLTLDRRHRIFFSAHHEASDTVRTRDRRSDAPLRRPPGLPVSRTWLHAAPYACYPPLQCDEDQLGRGRWVARRVSHRDCVGFSRMVGPSGTRLAPSTSKKSRTPFTSTRIR